MNLYIILCLLFVGIHGEKKIQLEDIERDNLKAETKSTPEDIQTEETKYATKTEGNQQEYRELDQFRPPANAPTSYAAPPRAQNEPSETYVQPNKYAVKEPAYQQQNVVLPESNVPLQYYSGYQQPTSLSTKAILPNVYESQQFIYQPEIAVGNQFQTVQQKAVTDKYAKNINKETVYVDIPMSHLLAYYPNFNIGIGRSNALAGQPLLHQLAAAAAQQISIPVYTPAFSQKPIIPIKPSYQLQYTAQHSNAIPATFTTKITKGAVYTTPVTSKKFTTSPLVSSPVYFQPDQSYAQGKKFLYTQAYVAPPQPRYIPQFVYTQPPELYTQASPVQPEHYSHAPSYVQDNSLHNAPSQYEGQNQQVHAQPTVAEEAPKQVLNQQTSQTVSENYVQAPEEPIHHFVPPQLPAQDFKSGVTQLLAVPPRDDESLSVQNHVSTHEARSLLDSYIPSRIIAAQDAERYRERPIKLEGGFLPSKENYFHKKRWAE